jgi:exodeoxyribonuclease VIII
MADFDVMIDIETFSTKKNAALASIGALKFNDKQILDTFYINVDPISSKNAGLDFQKSTLDWWKTQKPEAFDALKHNRVPLSEALAMFSEWYGTKSVPTWACGPDFDLVIMEANYSALNIQHPWKYLHARCFRTFKAMFKADTVRQGTYHNALDDATYQAQYIIDVMNKQSK